MIKKGTYKKLTVIGADTETFKGKPLTIQFYSDEKATVNFVNERNVTDKFFEYIDSLEAAGNVYLMYFHNLSFDMIEIFYPYIKDLVSEEFNLQIGSYKVHGVYSDVCFMVITHTTKAKTVYVLDSLAFFKNSLAALAEIFCPDLPKLKRMDDLGDRKYTAKDKLFMEYAKRDPEIVWHIGQFIKSMSDKFDISVAFTTPHFASKVFRHTFMQKDMLLPNRGITYAALHSYHGGKNNLTCEPGLYKKSYMLDIVSAYPFAMSRFPSFSDNSLYKVLQVKGRYTKPLPEFGIYQVSGYVKPCPWPILFDRSFKAVHGKVEKIWTTGPELNEGIQSGEIDPTYIFGYFYEAEKDPEPSPFKGYVDFFFDKKATAETKAERSFYKLLMNSLYGKFIQTYKSKLHASLWDDDTDTLHEQVVLKTGGLFHPFIASLISGHTRAYIHRLEHKYKALHTSTDGIITQIKPDKKDLVDGLGGLKIEAKGNCLIFRNKLYIMYSPKGERIKYALHGFHAGVEVLEEMYKKGVWEYEYTKVNKLKESLKRNLQVNEFVQRSARLNIGGITDVGERSKKVKVARTNGINEQHHKRTKRQA